MGLRLGTCILQDTCGHVEGLGERCLEGNWDKLITFHESSFLSGLQIVCGMSDKLLGECKAARGTSCQVLVGISCFVNQFLGGATLFGL